MPLSTFIKNLIQNKFVTALGNNKRASSRLSFQNRFIAGRSLNNAGMTLMEILIVMAILGALMAVLIPQVMSRLNKSKVNNTKLAMNQVVQSLTLYYGDCGTYPKTLEELMKPGADCPNADPEGYMKKEIKDAWNNSFIYSYSGSGEYELKSLGADRKEGGDGYNKDITKDMLQ